jgi:O-antigen ligase
LGVVVVLSQIPAASPISVTVQRQLQLTQGLDVSSLSGRTVIWQDKLNYLNSDPGHWLFGSGLGSATVDTESNYLQEAHMTYLEVVLEGGVAAFLAFLVWIAVIVAALAKYDVRWKPALWFSVALFVSALTQETFYPVAATQQFLALFLLTVAVVCGSGRDSDTRGDQAGVAPG